MNGQDRTAVNPRARCDPSFWRVIFSSHNAWLNSVVLQALSSGGEPLEDHSSLERFNFSRVGFYPPTVIADISLDDTLWREEVFGPVVVLSKFEVHAGTCKVFWLC
jgi:acyl-CoA reductase-like NAD-dependent aldehyde dehydrogenase